MRHNLADGMSLDEAHSAAQRSFGGVEQIKERVRDERGGIWLEQFLQDLRFGFRSLMRQRGFATISILTLGLGIGATTAIFSVLNAVFLKPLPYEQPGRSCRPSRFRSPATKIRFRPACSRTGASKARSSRGLTVFGGVELNLTGAGEPERISGMRFSANGLQLLRARPVLGRIFAPDEDQADKARVVVLTYEFWQNRFGGAADVIGRTISLNGEPFTVIGVLPARFLPRENPKFVVPYVLNPS